MLINLNINKVAINFLLVLICVYFAQGFFYPNGSIIAKLSLLIVLCISFLFFIKESLVKNKNLFLIFLSLFIVMNVIGYIAGANYGGVYYSQLRNIITAMLPFFAVYSLTKSNSVKESNLKLFFFVMLGISILNYFDSQSKLILEQDRDNVVSNVGYMFVSLLPLVFLFEKNKVVQMMIVLIMLFMTVKSAKRGAVISFSFGAMIVLLYQLKNSPRKSRFLNYILSFLMIGIAVFFAIYQLKNNEFLMNRMDGIIEGSGRNSIYSNLFNAWINSDDLTKYIFGFGFVATISKSGSGHLAHNDWLELLINFGLIGVFIYVLIFIYLLIYIKNKYNENKYRYGMLLIVTLWFFQAGFSMFYASSSSMFSLMLIGYYLGLKDRKQL